MSRVIIIAGGPTVASYEVRDLRRYGQVVGVNDAAVLCKVDVGLSMDRLWAENRCRDFFLRNSGDLWLREEATKNLPTHPRLRTFACDYRSSVLSDIPETFNGTHSGLCALNFAYQQRPKEIYLLGYDMCRAKGGEPYWYPPYPWANPDGGTKDGSYARWAASFGDAAKEIAEAGIQVFNVTHRSALDAFPKISFKDFIKRTSP